jgi:hypothetical protein
MDAEAVTVDEVTETVWNVTEDVGEAFSSWKESICNVYKERYVI